MPKVKLISEREQVEYKYSDSTPHMSVFNPDMLTVCSNIVKRMQAALGGQLPHTVHAYRDDPGIVVKVSFAAGQLTKTAEMTIESVPKILLTDSILQPAHVYAGRIEALLEIVRVFALYNLDHLTITRSL